MNTPPTKPVTTAPTPPDPEHSPKSGSTLIPTGEAQVGVVKKAPAAPLESERPEPVVEHPVHVPQAEHPSAAAPSAPTVAERTAALAATSAQQPLQESPPVSIPERMNHLHAENKRLRDEMQVLEKALKKSLN